MPMWFSPIALALMIIPAFDLPVIETGIVAIVISAIIRLVKGNN